MLSQARTSLFLSRDSARVPPACFLGRGQAFFFLVALPESRLHTSLGKDKPFPFARLHRSPACLLPHVWTCLVLSHDSGRVSPACFHGRGQAFLFLVTRPESRLLASSGKASLFLSPDSGGVPPAWFLARLLAFFFRVTLPKSCLLASLGEDKSFSFV